MVILGASQGVVTYAAMMCWLLATPEARRIYNRYFPSPPVPFIFPLREMIDPSHRPNIGPQATQRMYNTRQNIDKQRPDWSNHYQDIYGRSEPTVNPVNHPRSLFQPHQQHELIMPHNPQLFYPLYHRIPQETFETECGTRYHDRRKPRVRRQGHWMYPPPAHYLRYDYDTPDQPDVPPPSAPFNHGPTGLGCYCGKSIDCNRGSAQFYGSQYNDQCGHLGFGVVCCCHGASGLDPRRPFGHHRPPPYVGRPMKHGGRQYMFVEQ